MALGQSHNCPSDIEVTLIDKDKFLGLHCKHYNPFHANEKYLYVSVTLMFYGKNRAFFCIL